MNPTVVIISATLIGFWCFFIGISLAARRINDLETENNLLRKQVGELKEKACDHKCSSRSNTYTNKSKIDIKI